MANNLIHWELTSKIISCFYKVYNTLGYGFLEKVYENAIIIELGNAGLHCQSQVQVEVMYQSHKIGYYCPDLLVEGLVIVELKAAESICIAHETVLVNYLKCTNIEVGLLLNFGKTAQFKRKVFSPEFKNPGFE